MTWRCCRRPAIARASRTTRCILSRRKPGEQPSTLMDYFPDDFLLFVDESHISLPQVRGMYAGDRSRKDVLGRAWLPLAVRARQPATDLLRVRAHDRARPIFVSATPGPYEQEHSEQVVEQVIRPTGLIDPAISVRPTKGQIDDLLGEINARVAQGQRALVTTLTKRMAEDLADYLKEMGVRTHYLHSEIDTLRAGRDPARPPAGYPRRRRRHQPPARGTRPPRGVARRHSRRGQRRLPALGRLTHSDDRPRCPPRRRSGHHVRRHHDTLDESGDR